MAYSSDRLFILDNLRARVVQLNDEEAPKVVFEDLSSRADRDFTEFRHKFNTEIKKVEQEMARFRSELMDKNGNLLLSAFTAKAAKKPLSSSDIPSILSKGRTQHGISSIDQPSIQKKGKRKVMKLRFDVSQFKPEEVSLSAVDDKLSVQAKHEQKSHGKRIYRESSKQVHLPKGVKPNSIRSSVTEDGVLTVNAPLPDAPTSQNVYMNEYR